MKLSYTWLKDYVKHNLPPEDIAEILTNTGLEVETSASFESVKGGLEGLVVGEVIECDKHPNADKLSTTKVDIGTDEVLSIVCGAPNVAVGQKVAIAPVNSTLYPISGDPFKIRKAKIRGEVSMGMICAEDEIGLGQSHDGIMILPKETKVGTPLKEVFKIESDTIYDIGLTPNRGDGFSHYGAARDIVAALHAIYDQKAQLHFPETNDLSKQDKELKINIEIEDENACPRYSGIVLTDIEVKDSPKWLQNRLRAVGVQPINNVVDITNYVLQELGQPLHAFDYDKIQGKKIVVRNANKGEQFISLDGEERKLRETDLMICDADKPMCIAGVFGGIDSGITTETKNIFLESAYFDPTSIRITSTGHGLRTDAALHFEKGCDPEITVKALERAVYLLKEFAGAGIASKVQDAYPIPLKPYTVELSRSKLHIYMGMELDNDKVSSILADLDIVVLDETEIGWKLEVPRYREDVKRDVDVIEEIMRIVGYNSIPLKVKLNSSIPFFGKANIDAFQFKLSNLLSGAGLQEIFTNSISKSAYDEGNDEMIKLLNAQTSDLDSLRTGMFPGGLEVIEYNINRKNENLQLFDFGKTYHKRNNSYVQKHHLICYFTGKAVSGNWLKKDEKFSFHHVRSFVDLILGKTGLHELNAVECQQKEYEFGLQLYYEKEVLCTFGSIEKGSLTKAGIKQEVFGIDIDLEILFNAYNRNKIEFKELPKFPGIRRDLSMILNSDIHFQDVKDIAEKEGRKLLKNVDLFDVYKDDKLGKGKKSYAVSYMFQDENKTLTDKEIDKIMVRLIDHYEKELKASIRK